jgi:hypothetical protein
MSQQETLELCLSISGSFENGDPAYDAITGNFDGMGISVGILQWCAGTGSLSGLITKIIQYSSTETVNAFFANGENVASLAGMKPEEAKQFVLSSFTEDGMHLTAQAIQDWQAMLLSDPSIQAQIDLATNGVLAKAYKLAGQYTKTSNMRDVAFFFDVVTQSGGMSNSRGAVPPLPDPGMSTYQQAIQFALQHSPKSGQYWSQVCEKDEQARLLLHYAYQRALLSRPEFVWAAFSRRGTIACRGGVVNGGWFDFTELLP